MEQTAKRTDSSTSNIGHDLGWALGTLLRSYLEMAGRVVAELPGGTRAYQVLAIVSGSTCQNQAAIADRLGVNRTILTYLVDDLEAQGLVVRTPDPADRRARTISLTAQGQAVLAATAERLRHIEGHLLSGLSESEAESFRASLFQVALHAEQLSGEPLTCQDFESFDACR